MIYYYNIYMDINQRVDIEMSKIIITDGNIILYAELNSSLSASDFEKRLPCTLSGLEEDGRYHFSAARGRFDPMDYRVRLEKGNLTLDHGFFSICMKDDLAAEPCMIIGQLEPESLSQLANLPDTMNAYICLA